MMGVDKDLYKWSRDNWNKIPELVRQDCINELKAVVPAEVLATWKKQVRVGQEIGSDDSFFHMGSGMAVRNTLRAQLTDGELPEILQTHLPGNMMAQNWDDFYMGALQEFVEQEIAREDKGK